MHKLHNTIRKRIEISKDHELRPKVELRNNLCPKEKIAMYELRLKGNWISLSA